MRKSETELLVRKVAALDNRIVTDESVDSWHEVVGHIDFTVAERALVKARQDVSINWVEPRHVVAKARDAIIELNDEAHRLAREAEDEGRADPEPICRGHHKRITTCLECCRVLARQSRQLSNDRLHEWAVANMYVEEPF